MKFLRKLFGVPSCNWLFDCVLRCVIWTTKTTDRLINSSRTRWKTIKTIHELITKTVWCNRAPTCMSVISPSSMPAITAAPIQSQYTYTQNNFKIWGNVVVKKQFEDILLFNPMESSAVFWLMKNERTRYPQGELISITVCQLDAESKRYKSNLERNNEINVK